MTVELQKKEVEERVSYITITTLSEIKQAIEDSGLSVEDHINDGVLLVNYPAGDSFIPIAVTLSEEENGSSRLRFSVSIVGIGAAAEDHVDEMLFELLNLNTEIDPVSVAIDTSDPESPSIQARTALRVVSLQPEEVIGEIEGLIAALSVIQGTLKQFVQS